MMRHQNLALVKSLSNNFDRAMNVSLCIPSTAIRSSNVCNLAHATTVAYQIARLASIYNITEIVILDIPLPVQQNHSTSLEMSGDFGNKKTVFDQASSTDRANERAQTERGHEAVLLATLLQYFVTPPYLVKSLFKANERAQLKHATKLPKISAFVISSRLESGNFREGLSIPKRTPKVSAKSKKTNLQRKLQVTKFVNIGKEKPLVLDGQDVPVNVRVTVDLAQRKVVSPQVAYGLQGSNVSFGYSVRYAGSISSIYTELSVSGGYTETAFVEADDYFSGNSRDPIPSFAKKDKGTTLLLVGKWLDFENCAARDANISSMMDVIDCEIKVPKSLRVEDAAIISLAKIFEAT